MSVIAAPVLALLSRSGRSIAWHIARFPWESAGERLLRLL